jgi:anti-sigma regulatory factor (Ser/Thr protein kinase)
VSRLVSVRQKELELPFTPEAVPRARSVVRDLASGMWAQAIEDAELMVSEIVTNAVLHGAPTLRITVAVEDDELMVRVADGGGTWATTAGPTAPDAPSGRGLQIVDLLSTDWGVDVRPTSRGKTVWFSVRAQPEADRVGVRRRVKSGTAWN